MFLNKKCYAEIPVAKRTKCFQSKIFSKFIFHFFKKTKIELLSSAQNNVCATSCTPVLGAIYDWYQRLGGPPARYNVTPYGSCKMY